MQCAFTIEKYQFICSIIFTRLLIIYCTLPEDTPDISGSAYDSCRRHGVKCVTIKPQLSQKAYAYPYNILRYMAKICYISLLHSRLYGCATTYGCSAEHLSLPPETVCRQIKRCSYSTIEAVLSCYLTSADRWTYVSKLYYLFSRNKILPSNF